MGMRSRVVAGASMVAAAVVAAATVASTKPAAPGRRYSAYDEQGGRGMEIDGEPDHRKRPRRRVSFENGLEPFSISAR